MTEKKRLMEVTDMAVIRPSGEATGGLTVAHVCSVLEDTKQKAEDKKVQSQTEEVEAVIRM